MSGPYLRRGKAGLDPVDLGQGDLFDGLDGAYAGLADLSAAAWKLGGTNHASKAAFGVDELYYGAIFADEILREPAVAPGWPLVELKGEVEIALRVADGGYDAWCVALEMPSSPIANLLDCGVRALAADRCAAGALLLGPVTVGDLPDLTRARFTLEMDGAVLDVAGLDQLTDTPEQHFADFMVMAKGHGAAPKPGDWVATGGITRCADFREGGQVRVILDDQCVIDTLISQGV